MTSVDPGLRRLLRVAALLIVGGLVAQLVTLNWSHPIAFLWFLGLGVPLVVAGAATYLWALWRLTS